MVSPCVKVAGVAKARLNFMSGHGQVTLPLHASDSPSVKLRMTNIIRVSGGLNRTTFVKHGPHSSIFVQ